MQGARVTVICCKGAHTRKVLYDGLLIVFTFLGQKEMARQPTCSIYIDKTQWTPIHVVQTQRSALSVWIPLQLISPMQKTTSVQISSWEILFPEMQDVPLLV